MIAPLHVHIHRSKADQENVLEGEVTDLRRTTPTQWVARVDATDVHLSLPEGCAPPMLIGERVVVRQRTWIEGVHPINNATITTADGALLAALSAKGDPAWAPGWVAAVEDGAVVLASGGVRVRARTDAWEPVTVAGVGYVVRGDPSGPRFEIVCVARALRSA